MANPCGIRRIEPFCAVTRKLPNSCHAGLHHTTFTSPCYIIPNSVRLHYSLLYWNSASKFLLFSNSVCFYLWFQRAWEPFLGESTTVQTLQECKRPCGFSPLILKPYEKHRTVFMGGQVFLVKELLFKRKMLQVAR